MKLLSQLLSFILVQVPFGLGLEKQRCTPKNEVISMLEDSYGVEIANMEMTLRYDLNNMYINPNAGKNPEVYISDIYVKFSGDIISTRTNVRHLGTIKFVTNTVIVERTTDVINGKVKENCKVTYSEDYDIGDATYSVEVQEILNALTKYCLEYLACKKYSKISSNDFQAKQNFDLLFFGNVTSSSRNAYTGSQQSTLNAMTDFGISLLLKRAVPSNNGEIQIPNINLKFPHGTLLWRTIGEFEGQGGVLRDLNSLQRISDAIFSHTDLRFSVAVTYRLNVVKVQYQHYKIKYAGISREGELSISINGITMKINLAVDYNEIPCKVEIVKSEFMEVGNIDLNLTGFGILNNEAAKILKWIIRSKLFSSIIKTVEKGMSNLNCEKFRP